MYISELPSPTLPAKFTARPKLLKKITTAILETNITLTSEVTVTIRGVGGVGKSTLAKAVCHEQSVEKYFTDGFIWISLTPPHSVTDELSKIYNKLTNQQIEGALSFVKDKIQLYMMSNSSKFLVILDDVWEVEDAVVYVEVFRNCKILLTTRKFVTNSEIQTKNSIDIEPMELDEAVKLLTYRIDIFNTINGNDKAMLHKLAEDLHCWPLLLSLVHTQLHIYCIERKMSPIKAMKLINQQLCKSFTAFDKTSRDKAVKICLDTSLNLLPKEDIKVLQCVVLTVGGFGPYAIKDTVAKISKFTSEQFNKCEFNLWSHGLIESIDIPFYPTNFHVSCITVHHIIAHYIIEAISFEEVIEMLQTIESHFDNGKLMGIYIEEKFFMNNIGAFSLHLSLVIMLSVIRLLSISSCLIARAFHLNPMPDAVPSDIRAITDQLAKLNMYSTISEDSAKLVSLITNNKYADAVNWLKIYFESNPLLLLGIKLSSSEENISFESGINQTLDLVELHKCITVLMKIKASNEDIEYLLNFFYEL